MGFFSDIINAFSSWLTTKGNVAELKYKQKINQQRHTEYVKNQWNRLFSSDDYNSIRFLQKFIDNNNEWVEITEEIDDFLQITLFENIYRYSSVEKYYKNEKYPLFQTKVETKQNEYHQNIETKYIRISKILYKDFEKHFNQYIKKGLL